MPVKAFLAAHTSAEISELLADERIEPIGGLRGDMQAAVIARAIYASVGIDMRMSDLLLRFDSPKTVPTITSAEGLKGIIKPGK